MQKLYIIYIEVKAMSKESDKSNKISREDIEEVLSMATVSFTKEFIIKDKATIVKLEKSIENITPLCRVTQDVITKRKRNEEKLLRMLRSKA